MHVIDVHAYMQTKYSHTENNLIFFFLKNEEKVVMAWWGQALAAEA